MNSDTLIAICCYSVDQHQCIKALGLYLHHKCPVVVLSPADQKAEIQYPGIVNRISGHSGYTGQVSLDRLRSHLETLLTFPEKWFLIHESDSFCLSPELPKYLYKDPGVFWSNLLENPYEEQWPHYAPQVPRVALQFPYFMSRQVVEKLVGAADGVQMNPGLPYTDHYMLQLALRAEVGFQGFLDGYTWCSNTEEQVETMRNRVAKDGVVFIHAVKRQEVLEQMVAARREYERARELTDSRP